MANALMPAVRSAISFTMVSNSTFQLLLVLILLAGLSLPAQHVDESWQSAEFFANKVCNAISSKY